MLTDVPAATTKRGALAVLALASVLLLSTGCMPEVVGIGGTDGAGGSSNGSGNGNGNGDDSSEGDDSDSGAATGAECLPGNWYLDNEQFGTLMSTATGTVDNVTGTVMLTLTEDGHTHTHYDNWTHDITVKSSTTTLVKNGTDDGTYTVNDDGTMTMIDAKISSKTTAEVKIDGKTLATAVAPQESVFSQATFACKGDELRITAQGSTAVMHREH